MLGGWWIINWNGACGWANRKGLLSKGCCYVICSCDDFDSQPHQSTHMVRRTHCRSGSSIQTFIYLLAFGQEKFVQPYPQWVKNAKRALGKQQNGCKTSPFENSKTSCKPLAGIGYCRRLFRYFGRLVFGWHTTKRAHRAEGMCCALLHLATARGVGLVGLVWQNVMPNFKIIFLLTYSVKATLSKITISFCVPSSRYALFQPNNIQSNRLFNHIRFDWLKCVDATLASKSTWAGGT